MNTPINPNWDELLATNSDVKGWIKITGTAVNNVVVTSYDNSYYLTHNLYREDSVSGTIFSSYLNKWDVTDDNIILYGHNMISGEFLRTLHTTFPTWQASSRWRSIRSTRR